ALLAAHERRKVPVSLSSRASLPGRRAGTGGRQGQRRREFPSRNAHPRARAAAASIKNTSHFGIQLQFYYFCGNPGLPLTRAIAGLFLFAAVLPAKGEEVLVFAAASLTETLQEIGKTYVAKTGTSVQFSFAGSNDLERQIEAGAPAEVFFSADAAKMDALEKAGIVRHEDRREFLSNWLVVVVPADSKSRMHGPRDLLQFTRI